MKAFIIAFSLLVILCIIPGSFSLIKVHEALPPCRQTKYTSGLLALTWIGEYCSEKQCSRDWKDVWDGASFVIHGYWPQSDDLAQLTCLKQDGYDRFCDFNYPFSEKKLANISTDLNKYWPQIGAVKNFWKYEWEKHGTCYMKLIVDSFNSAKLSTDEIYLRYFRGAVNKVKSLSVQKLNKFKFESKEEFAKSLNLKADQFIAVCGIDNQLDQIRICYNLAEPEKESIISCTSKPKQCRYPIVLKGE